MSIFRQIQTSNQDDFPVLFQAETPPPKKFDLKFAPHNFVLSLLLLASLAWN